MEAHKRYDTIQDYLKGRLSADETVRFEEEMATSESLRAEVASHKKALMLTKFDYLKGMKATLDKTEKQYKKKQHLKKNLLIGALLLAGTIAIVGVITHQNGNNNQKPIPQVQQIGVDVSEEVVDKQNEEVDSSSKTVVLISEEDLIKKTEGETVLEKQLKEVASEKVVQKVEAKTTDVTPTTISSKKEPVEEVIKEKIAPKKAEVTQQVYPKDEVRCVTPEIKVNITKASAGGNNGEITINTLGTSTYQYKLNELNEGYINYNQFSDLTAGNYALMMVDEKGCEHHMGSYVVEESACHEKKDYAFNQQFEEYWTVPTNSSGLIEIISQKGKRVFVSESKNGETIKWNGTDLTNQQVAIGIYKVIIKTAAGEACIYNVIIEN